MPNGTVIVANLLALSCMVVNGVSSDRASVWSGVCQGSILGSLLFLIYINDLTDITFSEASKLAMYGDDILLYRPILSQDDFNALQTLSRHGPTQTT